AVPTTAASDALGVIGFMNAALGVRLVADFFLAGFAFFLAELFFAADFLAGDFEDFFAELFFFAVAIASPGG
ncbi:MAG: hypothetical protein H0T48_09375, partial [Gemmatimonadaceae bacterium]|nr:hypothetical protein [Gemmatimonadaceae bacterium]